MPTYEYKCRNCGYNFCKYQTITSGKLRKCPECNELKLQRIISAGAAVIFRGTGFYCTDYKNKPVKKENDTKKNTRKVDKEK